MCKSRLVPLALLLCPTPLGLWFAIKSVNTSPRTCLPPPILFREANHPLLGGGIDGRGAQVALMLFALMPVGAPDGCKENYKHRQIDCSPVASRPHWSQVHTFWRLFPTYLRQLTYNQGLYSSDNNCLIVYAAGHCTLT